MPLRFNLHSTSFNFKYFYPKYLIIKAADELSEHINMERKVYTNYKKVKCLCQFSEI